MRIIRRPLASVDLADIWDFIADDSERQADLFLDAFHEKFIMLARQPLMGRARPESSGDLRSFPFKRYVIFYLPLSDGIEIVRVLHSARDIGSDTIGEAP